MAAPGRAVGLPGESYRRHVRRKKVVALIAGLILLPLSLLLMAAYDGGPLGRAIAEVLGWVGGAPQPVISPTALSVAQEPSPTPTLCLGTVVNGLVSDAETGALLNDVRVSASFGATAATSPDGEYNLPICYDPALHDSFLISLEKDGYQSATIAVTTAGYPGITYAAPDVGLYAIRTSPPCQDTVFNGLVSDGATDAPLGGVRVTASFGQTVETSPDGEFNLLVCYDPALHAEFLLSFAKEGYEPASLTVAPGRAYPGLSYQVPDLVLRAPQTSQVTATPTLFQPPRQTPLPTASPTLFQPPRQTPLPTATPTLFQPPRQTPLPTAAESRITPTAGPTKGSGAPAPTRLPPETLPVTGVFDLAFPGQAIGFVLLAASLMSIAAGLWPQSDER